MISTNVSQSIFPTLHLRAGAGRCSSSPGSNDGQKSRQVSPHREAPMLSKSSNHEFCARRAHKDQEDPVNNQDIRADPAKVQNQPRFEGRGEGSQDESKSRKHITAFESIWRTDYTHWSPGALRKMSRRLRGCSKAFVVWRFGSTLIVVIASHRASVPGICRTHIPLDQQNSTQITHSSLGGNKSCVAGSIVRQSIGVARAPRASRATGNIR